MPTPNAQQFCIRRAALSAMALACACTTAHATNGYFAHGYGVQAQAMAGVGIALPQDGLTAATNPAGTAFVGDRLDLGLNVFKPNRDADISGNGFGLNGQYSGNGKKTFYIPEFGYSRQLSATTSVGLAVYGNGGMNTQYNQSPFAAFGGSSPAGVNLEQLFISPSLAFKLTPDQVLGVAVNLAYQRFSATGLKPFGDFGLSSDPANLTDRGTDSSTGAGVRLGWIGKMSPSLTLGATWASKVSGKFEKYKGLFADGGSFDVPANYGVGMALQLSPQWTLAADYQLIQYSGVKAVSNPLSQLTTGGNLLGSPNGPGFGWKDMSVYKFGVRHQYNQAVTLRAGYSHATQPVPQDQTFFNILAPGVVQDHLTLGLSWKTDAHTEWSAVYGHAMSKTVKGQGSIPSSFGGGEANIRLKEDTLGVSYGWKF